MKTFLILDVRFRNSTRKMYFKIVMYTGKRTHESLRLHFVKLYRMFIFDKLCRDVANRRILLVTTKMALIKVVRTLNAQTLVAIANHKF